MEPRANPPSDRISLKYCHIRINPPLAPTIQFPGGETKEMHRMSVQGSGLYISSSAVALTKPYLA